MQVAKNFFFKNQDLSSIFVLSAYFWCLFLSNHVHSTTNHGPKLHYENVTIIHFHLSRACNVWKLIIFVLAWTVRTSVWHRKDFYDLTRKYPFLRQYEQYGPQDDTEMTLIAYYVICLRTDYFIRNTPFMTLFYKVQGIDLKWRRSWWLPISETLQTYMGKPCRWSWRLLGPSCCWIKNSQKKRWK